MLLTFNHYKWSYSKQKTPSQFVNSENVNGDCKCVEKLGEAIKKSLKAQILIIKQFLFKARKQIGKRKRKQRRQTNIQRNQTYWT